MRKLTALASVGVVAVAVLAAVPAVPAAASSLYCFYDINASAYVGSTSTKGGLVPIDSNCQVLFTRINFHAVSGTGFYEYQVASGPGKGMCLKEDPGITDDGDHPVVDYPCTNVNNATRNEELWTDPPYPEPLASNGWVMVVGAQGYPEGLYTETSFFDEFTLQGVT